MFDRTSNRIYVSGKITGLPREEYMANFERAEAELTKQGYVVLNPAKVGDGMPESTTWEEYMELCICMLRMCSKIYLPENWTDSRGALVELEYAKTYGYEVIEEAANEQD